MNNYSDHPKDAKAAPTISPEKETESSLQLGEEQVDCPYCWGDGCTSCQWLGFLVFTVG